MPTSLETEELDCTCTLLFPIFFLAGEVWKDVSGSNFFFKTILFKAVSLTKTSLRSKMSTVVISTSFSAAVT